jgi:hypothetical protein
MSSSFFSRIVDKTKFIPEQCSISYGNFLIKLDNTANAMTISNSKPAGKLYLNSETVEINGQVLNINDTSSVNITTPLFKVNGETQINTVVYKTDRTITNVLTINGFAPHAPTP